MRFQVLVLSALFLMSCSVGPSEIQYGEDACHFCKMTIVDKQHAAELVTVKGKAYKYDAIECMIHELKDWQNPDVAIYLVADFADPGKLTDATKANYLISETIPSPMGAFLSAFGQKSDLEEILKAHEGEYFNWDSINDHLDKN